MKQLHTVATFHQPVPLTPALVEVPLYCQWVIGSSSLSYSQAAKLLPLQY